MNTNENFVDTMERLFGSDEALGVYFLTDGDEYGRNQVKLSPVEQDEMYNRLGDDMPGTSSYLPHGGSACCCTDYAMHIYQALPGRVQIFGFSVEDNPTSRVARDQIHPGGHDFALVDGRYIVDPWPRLVPGVLTQMVFDLDQGGEDGDAALAHDVLGPRACWRHMHEAQSIMDEMAVQA
jgi:hypothetical protein